MKWYDSLGFTEIEHDDDFVHVILKRFDKGGIVVARNKSGDTTVFAKKYKHYKSAVNSFYFILSNGVIR